MSAESFEGEAIEFAGPTVVFTGAISVQVLREVAKRVDPL